MLPIDSLLEEYMRCKMGQRIDENVLSDLPGYHKQAAGLTSEGRKVKKKRVIILVCVTLCHVESTKEGEPWRKDGDLFVFLLY